MAKKKKKNPRAHGADGRREDGKFGKGNQCAIGNKSHTSEKSKALKEVLLKAVTPEKLKKILDALITKANSGDIPAIKELFDRIWGRAPQSVAIGGEDGGPINIAIVDYSKVDLEVIKPK